jgi:hypothetical protein
MGRMFIPMAVIAIWFEECLFKIPMNHGLGVGRF